MRTMLFSMLFAIPAAALAQTPSDLARLSGSATSPTAMAAPLSATTPGGASAWDLARLQATGGKAPASTNTAPAAFAETHGFVAADLVALSGRAVNAPQPTAEMLALLRPAR